MKEVEIYRDIVPEHYTQIADVEITVTVKESFPVSYHLLQQEIEAAVTKLIERKRRWES
jgi:hypothetical protein